MGFQLSINLNWWVERRSSEPVDRTVQPWKAEAGPGGCVPCDVAALAVYPWVGMEITLLVALCRATQLEKKPVPGTAFNQGRAELGEPSFSIVFWHSFALFFFGEQKLEPLVDFGS